MDKIVEQALLYDFYGELLTEHQRNVYEQFVFQDLSLSEIGETTGVSRQGVHDLIKRCNKQLADYEAKLHLVEKFTVTKDKVSELKELFETIKDNTDTDIYGRIEGLMKEILE